MGRAEASTYRESVESLQEACGVGIGILWEFHGSPTLKNVHIHITVIKSCDYKHATAKQGSVMEQTEHYNYYTATQLPLPLSSLRSFTSITFLLDEQQHIKFLQQTLTEFITNTVQLT